tara:strand:+ start:634 stop:1419 length:786 start_codon:yes stop_codon:yes gene_type:complete
MARPHSKTQNKRSHHRRPQPKRPDGIWIYGRHPVEAALANPKRDIARLVATDEAARHLNALLSNHRPALSPEIVDRQQLDRMVERGAVHQGLAIQVAELPNLALDQAVAATDLVVVLDQVADPHNVGAILRSAAAFGAAAVIMQDRHSPSATGTLAKSASGSLEWVSLVRVTNLARSLDELKDLGFWIAGLDGEAPQELGKIPLQSPLALALGAEGSGLRRLTREACDTLVHIPSARDGLSLNVSNAAAVALFEARRAISG